jgi:multidrug efflux pump subunit AcrA (membrane-fusion protein)
MKPHHCFLWLALAGCTPMAAQTPSPPTNPPGANAPGSPGPAVGKPERRSLTRTVEQPARVEAFAQAPLLAKIAGYVKAIHADIGDRVKAGQPLAEIDVPELEEELKQKQALVAQAAAEVEQARKLRVAAEAHVATAVAAVAEAEAGRKRARANFDRWQSEAGRVAALVEKRVIDEQTRDETLNQFRAAEAALGEVEARVKSAEASRAESEARRDKATADVAVAEAKARVAAADEGRTRATLGYARLVAPFDGVVTARNVDVGHLLQPSATATPLFVVTKLDPVRVFAEVPEADAALVGPGAKAEVTVQALRGRKFTGTVTRTAWALEARSRTLLTAIDLPNPDGVLRPGLYAYAAVTAVLPEAWTLPVAAVVRQGDAGFAFLVRDGKAVRVKVQTGFSDGTRVEVLKIEAGTTWVEPTGDETFVLKAAGVTDGQVIAAEK